MSGALQTHQKINVCIGKGQKKKKKGIKKRKEKATAAKMGMIELMVRNLYQEFFRCMILDAWGWCTETTHRDGMGRKEGGGFRMGNTCIPVADSC